MTDLSRVTSAATPAARDNFEQIALVDLLDRLLGGGVVLAGDVVISIAGIDLVQVKLHAMITSVRSEMAQSGGHGAW